MKHFDQKPLRGGIGLNIGRIYLDYIFRAQSASGKSGQELKWSRNRNPGGTLLVGRLSGLLAGSCLANVPKRSRSTSLGMVLPTVDWVVLLQLIMKMIPSGPI